MDAIGSTTDEQLLHVAGTYATHMHHAYKDHVQTSIPIQLGHNIVKNTYNGQTLQEVSI